MTGILLVLEGVGRIFNPPSNSADPAMVRTDPGYRF
jgi:hypothetical protein